MVDCLWSLALQDFVTSSEKNQLRQSCPKLLGKGLRKVSGNIANDFSSPTPDPPAIFPFLSFPSFFSVTNFYIALGKLELLMGFHSICGLGLWTQVWFGHGFVTELCHWDSAVKPSLTGCEAEKATVMLSLISSIYEKLKKGWNEVLLVLFYRDCKLPDEGLVFSWALEQYVAHVPLTLADFSKPWYNWWW